MFLKVIIFTLITANPHIIIIGGTVIKPKKLFSNYVLCSLIFTIKQR